MYKKICLSFLVFVVPAAFVVLAAVGLYVWNPILPWQDEITVYRARCSNASDSGIVCLSEFVAGERQRFRIQPEQAEVVTWNEDGHASEIRRYRNCAIRNLENWRCPAQGDLVAISMIGGDLRLSVPDMLVNPQVYRWQWRLLDFGLMEYKFYRWSKDSFFGKWVGFPSTYDAIMAIRDYDKQRKTENVDSK